jgi:hypothetical protein
MDSPYLCPIEDAIGQPMLQVPERGSTPEIAKFGIIGSPLKLRIIHYQFQARIASRCSEDGGCLKQAIGHRIREKSAPRASHCRLNGSGVEEIALDDLGTMLAEFIRPCIEFVDEGAHGNALPEQETRDEASG